MKVNFYATLRQIAGHKTEEFAMNDGMTVGDLLEAVLERHPDMRPELMDEEGNLYRHVHLFVNGRDAYYLDDGMETQLQASDKINLFPAVGGG